MLEVSAHVCKDYSYQDGDLERCALCDLQDEKDARIILEQEVGRLKAEAAVLKALINQWQTLLQSAFGNISRVLKDSQTRLRKECELEHTG